MEHLKKIIHQSHEVAMKIHEKNMHTYNWWALGADLILMTDCMGLQIDLRLANTSQGS